MSALADHPLVLRLIALALAEDLPAGDVTSEAVINSDQQTTARILAREPGILAGSAVTHAVFQAVDPNLDVALRLADGDDFVTDQEVARIRGGTRAILAAERTALNFLQRLCGVATQTRRYVERIAGTDAVLLPTRKTTPGHRLLERAAVRSGGGGVHRGSLSDGVLIKDNHLAAGGGIAATVGTARAAAPRTLQIEVEVGSLDEVRAAVTAAADIIMFDNMSPAEVRQACALCDERIWTEASGGITLENIRAYAETGVRSISVGALTHSVRAIDLSLEFDAEVGTP